MRFKKNKTEVVGTNLIETLVISDNFYDKQENRLLTLLLKGLIVYLVSAGMLGGAITATGTYFNQIIFNVIIAVLSIIISLIYYNKKTENIGDILYLFGIIFFGVFLGAYINSGFYTWMNDVLGAASVYFQLPDIGGYNQAISDSTLTVTIASCYLGAVVVILVNMSIAKRMVYGDLILNAIIVLFLPQYFGLEPNYYYFVILVSGIIFASIWKNTGRFTKVDNNSVYIRTKRDITYTYNAKAHAFAFLQIFVCIVAFLSLIYVTIPKDLYNLYRSKSSIKDYSDDYVQTFITSGIAGFFNRYENVAGMSSGRLGGVNSVRLDYETNLEITFVPYAYEPIYIRTFIGGEYRPYQNMWNIADPTKLNRNEYENLKKDFLLDKSSQGKARILVNNIDAEYGEFAFYYTQKDHYINKGEQAERYMYPKSASRTYTYDNVLSDEERAYWLKVPNDNVPSIINTLKIINVPNDLPVLAKTDYIKKYYYDNVPYTLRPGSTPYRKDFINYFLDKNKKGYCVHFASAATLMFRYMGIPARYVEGYVFDYSPDSKTSICDEYSYEDFYEGYNELGEMPVLKAELTDATGHAWIEVFIDGFGWVPVEVTPPSSDTEMTNEGFLTRLLDIFDSNPTVNNTGNGNNLPTINVKAVRSSIIVIFVILVCLILAYIGVRFGLYIYKYKNADINTKLIIRYGTFLNKKKRRIKELELKYNYKDQLMVVVNDKEVLDELVSIMEKAGFSNKEITQQEFDYCIKQFKNI